MKVSRLVACVAVLIALAAGTQTRESRQSLVARGDCLVNGIMTCNHCHTPKDKAGNPVMARRFDEVTFTATGSNITPDAETGIGRWSDADIRRARIESVSRAGRVLSIVVATTGNTGSG